MHTPKLIEYFKGKTLEEMREIYVKVNRTWVAGSTGIHLNPNFTWDAGTEATCNSTGSAWHEADEIGITGTDIQKEEAQELLVPYQDALSVIMTKANVLHLGVLSKLESTGGVMAETGGEVGVMAQAVIKDIDPVKGVSGMFKVAIVPSEKHCFGTHIRITNLSTGAVREVHVHEKSHLIITDCPGGTRYNLEVAYDGANPLKVWSDPKPFWGQ